MEKRKRACLNFHVNLNMKASKTLVSMNFFYLMPTLSPITSNGKVYFITVCAVFERVSRMSQMQARQVQCPVILDGYPFNENIVHATYDSKRPVHQAVQILDSLPYIASGTMSIQ